MADWIINTIEAIGYLGIFLLMALENIFPPLPSEFIMPLAGYMATEKKFTLFGVILSGTLGSLAGNLPLYYLGSRLGKDRLKRFISKNGRWLALSPPDIDRANDWFSRQGHRAVMLCRLVPGIRSLISIPAGFNNMNLFRFLLFSFAGTVVWISFLACVGFFLGKNFSELDRYLDAILYVIIGLAIFLYLRRIILIERRR
ncbi:membrane protein DedA with SNARE-associated domain [Anseongella ginsenosidimutans]|uniref:Membrane protein DedA with SNARE-associated domain n=1 Tax=Anseongella ginsenosidimutans TaxID=496056 RepID=A0A4R3KQB5_9SPHI|nr:DedA family protein [Anseongella ginsenosidimutans]QEC52572.1 DedA family protein [Anseongella ginsenosidimutans]TCS86487.1 membrane protein DedA with SNARE-associated domain [Anseongella ginsenosidimutans]